MNVLSALRFAVPSVVLPVAALGLAACDRNAIETVGGAAGAASEAPIDAVPSDARVASSSDGMVQPAPRRVAARTEETPDPAPGGGPTAALNAAPAASTSQETIAATRTTLSPAGASSGPTAPAPK